LAPCAIEYYHTLESVEDLCLIFEWHSFFVDNKEIPILRKLMHMHASHIEDSPAFVIYGPSEDLREIRPREPRLDLCIWKCGGDDRNGANINAGLLRVLQDEDLCLRSNRRGEFAYAVTGLSPTLGAGMWL
jgi:hypothetical protein